MTLKKSSASMSSCAAADARPRVCVRSTMKKRRPSSFTRIPRAFTASAAVRRAMSSTLCASTTISAMSRLSSSWAAAPVCRCPRRMTASPVRASACWRSTAAPRATSTRTSTPKHRRPPWPPLLEGKARPVRCRHPPVRPWLRAGGLRRPAALPQAPRLQ